MRKLFNKMILTIAMVVTSTNVSAQINELKQYLAEQNKECPVDVFEGLLSIDKVKYENGYVILSYLWNNIPSESWGKLKQAAKNDRNQVLNLDQFVHGEDYTKLVSLMTKTNTGLKNINTIKGSSDSFEVIYSAEEIKEALKKDNKEPSGMEYIKWAIQWHNDNCISSDKNALLNTDKMTLQDNSVELTVLVPRRGIYKQLDFNAVKTNRMVFLTMFPQLEKLLKEMIKQDMPLVILIKDMHSSKSHKIKLDANSLKGYVN